MQLIQLIYINMIRETIEATLEENNHRLLQNKLVTFIFNSMIKQIHD